MKKIIAVAAFLFSTVFYVNAQQYGLFNTGTLFDALENPAQKHFTLDSSRKFSSNFFLPYFGISGSHKGNTDDIIRRMVSDGVYDTRTLALGAGNINRLDLHTNIYLLAFKMYKSYKYNQEVGVSWQLRTDAHIAYTDETLALFDSFRRFMGSSYIDVFNTKGYEQAYHQISVSYREDIDKKLSVGVKVGVLSGIVYNQVNVKSSSLRLDMPGDRLDIGINGVYKGNFVVLDSLKRNDFFPLFKNPGLSASAGFKYRSKSGFTIMGNIKDLGFIRWNSKSNKTIINTQLTFTDLSNPNTNTRISNKLLKTANDAGQQSAFFTATNAKADIYVSKAFGVYRPALILSKNIFYPGGEAAMVNTLTLGNLSGSITPAYNLNNFFMMGAQGMYKTHNFEFFMGSDNLLKTYYAARSAIQEDYSGGSGYYGASFYMGLGIKIGRVVQHPLNSDYMPGVGDDEQRRSFLQKIFGRKKPKLN